MLGGTFIPREYVALLSLLSQVAWPSSDTALADAVRRIDTNISAALEAFGYHPRTTLGKLDNESAAHFGLVSICGCGMRQLTVRDPAVLVRHVLLLSAQS